MSNYFHWGRTCPENDPWGVIHESYIKILVELGCLNVNILSQPWPRYNDLTLQAALLFFLNNLGTFSMLIIIYNDIFYPTHICAFRFGDCFNELSQSLLPSPLAWCNYVVQQAAPQDQVYIRHEHFPRHEEMPFFPLTDIIRGGGRGGSLRCSTASLIETNCANRL